jgi:hypothetical protein
MSGLAYGRLAAAADAATVSATAVAVVLALVGGVREAVGGDVIAIGWRHAAFAALAIAAVRHTALPRPSILHTLQSWRRSLAARPALRDAAVAFCLTRPTVVAVGLLATVTVGLAPAAKEALESRDPIRVLPARWDAQWYAGIAADGYEWRRSFDLQQNLAFFPAYPLLMRAAGAATGAFRTGVPPDRRMARLTWCGLVISLAAFLWAAWYFASIARTMLGETRGLAALLLLSAYPFALFYSAAYTESLYLLGALGAWFHFRRGETAPAVAWGLLTGLTRPNGCFLSIPLGLLALGVRDLPAGSAGEDVAGLRRPLPWRLAVAATPGVGMLLFTLYAYHLTGIWFAWSKTHAAWGRVMGSGSPLSGLAVGGSAGLLGLLTTHPYDVLNGLALAYVLWSVRAIWRLSPAWAVFVLVSVAVPFSAGGLLSMGRITSTLFPVFLASAAVLPTGTSAGLTAMFGLLQGLLAALFYTWRDVY